MLSSQPEKMAVLIFCPSVIISGVSLLSYLAESVEQTETERASSPAAGCQATLHAVLTGDRNYKSLNLHGN